jgi:hypothetical protein
MPYPKVYQTGWWDNYHTLSGTTATGNSDFRLVWFSIDPFVYMVDTQGNERLKIYAGSEQLVIKALKGKRPVTFSVEGYENYYQHIAKTGWYASMYYDPFRKLYYRVGFHGAADEYKGPNQVYSHPFLIVLDNTFCKLGEFPIDSNVYNALFCFIGPQGLCVLNKIDQEKDENFLHFDVFQVELNK